MVVLLSQGKSIGYSELREQLLDGPVIRSQYRSANRRE
jgi:hypothetical protein